MPDPRVWEQAKEIFHEASELPRSRRDSYVRRACVSDEQLLAQVNQLLAGHDLV